MKLRRDRMTREEYEKYLQIGEIDYSQNWLELFTPHVISDLFTIMESSSDNQDKCDIIQEELGKDGFEPVGLGTNVYATSHPAYPGVVFKIALDPCGLADNFNDATLCDMVNSYLGKKKFTQVLARHPSGIVTVQERKVLMKNQDRISAYRADITKTLDKLAEAFIIVDLSPSEFHFNYGIERNGDWCFIDASDLYPLSRLKEPLRCKMTVSSGKEGHMETCNGDLVYSNDYRFVRCERCGRVYIPSDIRPKEKKGANEMSIMTDGLELDEIEQMNKQEMQAAVVTRTQHQTELINRNAIYGAMGVSPQSAFEPSNVGLSEDEDDDEEESVEETPIVQPEPEVAKAEPPKKISKLGSLGSSSKPKFQSVEQKRDIPEGVPVPVKQSAFTSTKPIPLKNRSEEDDDEIVEPQTTANVPQEKVNELATPFTPKPVSEYAGDEEEDDEDDIHVVNWNSLGTARTPGLPVKPETNDDEPDLEYVIMDDPTMDGILIKVKGDFEEAWEDCALPIYISLDDGKTLECAVRTSELLPLVRAAVERNREDIELTQGVIRERSGIER